MSDPATIKADLRRQMLDRRRAVSTDIRTSSGKAACESIIGAPLNLLTRAWRVCLYLSAAGEIPTRYIARAVWEAGREVCVPAWSSTEKAYKLYAIDPSTRLVTGHYGIREPALRVPVMTWDVDAFIIPGLAFDSHGGRLGHGAGYYDRILGKASRHAPKIGLCYDWQLVDAPLPQEPHDIAMDWVVTDTQAIPCAANRKDAAG